MSNASLRFPAPESDFRQGGSALILAILVAGIVASLGVGITQAFMVDVARIENRMGDVQARQYLLAAEDMASLVLLNDQTQGGADHLLEDWAQVLPPLPTGQGSVELRIEDAQGRFNLNSLVDRTANIAEVGLPVEQRFTLAQQQFMHLLQGVEDLALSAAQALALTEALIDWIDEDDDVLGFGGAESLYYVNAQPSHAAPNRLLQSLNELQVLRHMSPELLERLRPLVVVLPESTALNLNTASWPLLASAADAVAAEPALALSLQERQRTRPFESLNAVADMPELAEGIGSGAERSAFGVSSRYYLLQARVREGNTERSLVSLLWRGESEVRVLTRHFGSPLENPAPWP